MDPFWGGLQDQVGTILEGRLKSNQQTWFRGQATSWPLLPKLHRRILAQRTTNAQGQHVRDRGKFFFAEFKRHAWSLLAREDKSPWGIVCAMQHYGMETRLLDWTENFACAVYFALAEAAADEGVPTLYILDPLRLNRRSGIDGVIYLDDTPLDPDPTPATAYHPLSPMPTTHGPLAVCPLLANGRMRAQRACFTMAADDYQPLEAFVGDDADTLSIVPIPPSAIPDARRFVITSGTERLAVFPDLQGVSTHFDELAARIIRATIGGEAIPNPPDASPGEHRKAEDGSTP